METETAETKLGVGGYIVATIILIIAFFWEGVWASLSWNILAAAHNWPQISIVDAALICGIITATTGTAYKADIKLGVTYALVILRPIITFIIVWIIYN